MVPITCQSRVHLIRSYITVLASLFLLIIFIDTTITHGASIEDEDVCGDNTKISILKKHCSNSNASLILSNLSISCILNMTLDFCVDAFPLGFLLSNMSRTIRNLPSKCTMYIPGNVSCGDIDDILQHDKMLQDYHKEFVDVLERSEFNLQAHNPAASKNDSDKCQRAYKDWLCSSTDYKYMLNNTRMVGCKNTSEAVCLNCPSFKADDGGLAFQCSQGGETDNGNGDSNCQPKCISSERLRNFVYGGDNG